MAHVHSKPAVGESEDHKVVIDISGIEAALEKRRKEHVRAAGGISPDDSYTAIEFAEAQGLTAWAAKKFLKSCVECGGIVDVVKKTITRIGGNMMTVTAYRFKPEWLKGDGGK